MYADVDREECVRNDKSSVSPEHSVDVKVRVVLVVSSDVDG
jgi:hypothetical protein